MAHSGTTNHPDHLPAACPRPYLQPCSLIEEVQELLDSGTQDTTRLFGMVWYGMVWYGMVRYGKVWNGMVWYGMVRYGMVWPWWSLTQYGGNHMADI